VTSNKLTCVTHNRRVIVMAVPDRDAVATHRSGAHERCSSPRFSIGGKSYTANEIVAKDYQNTPSDFDQSWGVFNDSDPALTLLREIFSDPNYTRPSTTSPFDPRQPALRGVRKHDAEDVIQ